MATLKDITLYTLINTGSISHSALVKIIYLADYLYASNNKQQYTNIKWYFDTHGPFVNDVKNSIENVLGVSIRRKHNIFNEKGNYFSYAGIVPEIEPEIKGILDYCISVFKSCGGYTKFIKYIYNTYPVKHSKKKDYINLEQKVEEEDSILLEESYKDTVERYGDVLYALAQ